MPPDLKEQLASIDRLVEQHDFPILRIVGYEADDDPDFDAKQKAFYYVRVIEIPRPRWTAYDAAYFDLDLPKEIPTVVQDRAYTSPIWYTP